DVEARVLQGVKHLLLAPAVIEAAMRRYETEVAQRRVSSLSRRAALQKSLAGVKAHIDRLLGLYEREVIDLSTFKERFAGLEDKRHACAAELESLEDPPAYSIHPKAVDRYRE